MNLSTKLSTKLLTCTLFTAALVATTAASAPAAYAECAEVKENPKPAIPFVPVDRTNPATGQPYGPTDKIAFGDKQVLASTVFDGIDSLERSLTANGYTLRNATPETLAELGACTHLLSSQVALLDILLSDSTGTLSAEVIRAKVQKAIDQARDKVPNWGEVFEKANAEDREIYLPPIPTYSAPVPTLHRTPTKPLLKERSWAWEMGEKNSMWVQTLANFRINGTKTAANAVASGTINASVLGKWEGEALHAEATANVADTHIAQLAINVRGVGQTLFTRNWSKTFSEGALQEQGEKSYAVNPEADYRFAIGPVPCRGRVGFVGSVGLKYGYTLVPVQIMAFAVPFAATKVYAQVGADIIIASAGIGGELTLVNNHVTLQGGFSATFEDEPTFVLELTGKSQIEALKGNLYAYAKVGVWPLDWEGRFTIYDWSGYKKDSNLFTFRTTWSPNGIKAEGDLTAEDVMEVQAADREHRVIDLENASTQRAHDVFTAIANDLNGPIPATVRTQNALHTSVAQGIDASIAQFLADVGG
ncbi:MAG: hypothetical protein H7138_16880 [Myxococcales bacterium]|nr:hypothetical protein [Myxococcales bacterium]